MTNTRPIQTLTLSQWAKGSSWRAELQHSEKAHALVHVTRGQGLCTVLGKRRGIGANNVIFIPAGTMFSIELGRAGFGQVCLIPPNGPVMMPDEPLHLRLRDVSAQAELTAIFDVLYREQSATRLYRDEAMMAHANLLSVWLRRTLISEDEAQPKTPAAERLINAYAAVIERDFKTRKPMADYARTLGVTPTHLARCCRQVSGQTAADMITGRNLHAALEMLEETRDPIGQIANLLGFNSAAYFSRFILHHTGENPSALRSSGSVNLLN
jgi:AraC family transcriptional activator of pobA